MIENQKITQLNEDNCDNTLINNGNVKKLKEDIKRREQRISTLKSKIDELNTLIQNNMNNKK